MAEANPGEAIHSTTTELLEALIEDNGLEERDVASAIFTMTPDLNAVFPTAICEERRLSDPDVGLELNHRLLEERGKVRLR